MKSNTQTLCCVIFLPAYCRCGSSDQEVSALEPCYEDFPTVLVATDEIGTVSNYYDPNDTLWVILSGVGIEGQTFDSRNVGMVCGFPDELKIQGAAVVFSGNFKNAEDDYDPRFPGHSMYHLSLTSIEHSADNELDN